MISNPIFRAWMWLVVLSGGSTVVTLTISQGLDRRIAAALILVLALSKSRVILAQYLGLSQAPSWRRGFNVVLGIYFLMLLLLFLI